MHTQLLSTINHSTYSTSYLTQLWSPTSLQYLPHISVLNQAYEEQFQLFSPPMFSLYNFITFIAPQSNPCAVALNYLLCIHQLVSSTFFFCSNHFVISWGIPHPTFHHFSMLEQNSESHPQLHQNFILLFTLCNSPLPLLHNHQLNVLDQPFLWTFLPLLLNFFSHFCSQFNTIPSHFLHALRWSIQSLLASSLLWLTLIKPHTNRKY